MSCDSYLNIQRSKQWACPNYVPIFISLDQEKHNHIMYEKLLLKLAKLLNPLRIELTCTCDNAKVLNYINVTFNELFDNYGIG